MELEQLAASVLAGVRPGAPRTPVIGNTNFVISEEGVVVFDGGGVPAMANPVIDRVRLLTEYCRRPVRATCRRGRGQSVGRLNGFGYETLARVTGR